ncbi:MAG: hypothetical protein ACYDBQ_06155 [Thermoplasmatota archaeon]
MLGPLNDDAFERDAIGVLEGARNADVNLPALVVGAMDLQAFLPEDGLSDPGSCALHSSNLFPPERLHFHAARTYPGVRHVDTKPENLGGQYGPSARQNQRNKYIHYSNLVVTDGYYTEECDAARYGRHPKTALGEAKYSRRAVSMRIGGQSH